MNVIVTTGPSYEPIDEVRRLTNFSTGELGVLLANQLAAAGFQVDCLRGVAATFPGAPVGCQHLPFTTNDDLLRQLADLSESKTVHAIFQVAALCDFKVKQAVDDSGAAVSSVKIESRGGGLTLRLEPAAKVIRELCRLFPAARIVGWKYELAGTRAEALAKARRQIRENHTDACVLNGRAWGDGFAFCTPPDRVDEIHGKSGLASFLVEWLKSK